MTRPSDDAYREGLKAASHHCVIEEAVRMHRNAASARGALERCRDGAEIALGAEVDHDRALQVLRAIREAAVAVVGER